MVPCTEQTELDPAFSEWHRIAINLPDLINNGTVREEVDKVSYIGGGQGQTYRRWIRSYRRWTRSVRQEVDKVSYIGGGQGQSDRRRTRSVRQEVDKVSQTGGGQGHTGGGQG